MPSPNTRLVHERSSNGRTASDGGLNVDLTARSCPNPYVMWKR